MDNNRNKERIERAFEIILIIIGVCAVIFCFAYFTDTFKSFLPDKTLKLTNSTKDNTEIYNALAVEVNAINNILTWGSFIVAALTIAAAFFGVLGVSAFREETRNNTKSSKKEIENIKIRLTKAFNDFAIDQNTRLDNHNNTIESFIDDINTRFNDFEDDTNARLEVFTGIIDNYTNRVDQFTTQIDNLRVYLSQQVIYFDQIINYLYQVTYLNIEHMEDQTHAQQLLENLFHELQIAKLYRTIIADDEVHNNNINRIAALEYLENNGRMEDIPHLEYIAKNDPNEIIRDRAIKIIGRIEERNQKKDKEDSQDDTQEKVSDAKDITSTRLEQGLD